MLFVQNDITFRWTLLQMKGSYSAVSSIIAEGMNFLVWRFCLSVDKWNRDPSVR